MARVPDYLALEHHRDFVGRERRPVVRLALLFVLGLFLLLGLLNLFGQQPQTDVVENDVARLELYSPKRLRSGLYYESRFPDGRIALDLGRIPAGRTHLFFLQFQVNPTNVGHRAADVELHDGERPLLHLDRTVTIFP